METFLRRNFKVKGNISCIYKPNNIPQAMQIEKIEVQLWHQAPLEKIFLGNGYTDNLGDFIVEFEADSPSYYIKDGKITNVFLEAYSNGLKISDNPTSSLQEGLVAYWKFDETEGTIALDATGNNHYGTLAGAVLPTHSTGKINNGINLHGEIDGSVESYIRVESSDDFNFGTGDFGFSFWIKYNNTDNFDVINTGDPGTDTLVLTFDITGNLFIIEVDGHNVYNRTFSYNPNTWYHVVIRRSGTDIEALINKVSLGVRTCGEVIACDSSFFIGKNKNTDSTLNGTIDEFGVWKGRYLSDDDVLKLYNDGYGLQFPFL